MDDTRYQIFITGKVVSHIPREQAVRAFAEIFCLSPQEAALRFSAAPFVLRGSLSQEHAEKYCRVIRRQGIDCEAKPEVLGEERCTPLPDTR